MLHQLPLGASVMKTASASCRPLVIAVLAFSRWGELGGLVRPPFSLFIRIRYSQSLCRMLGGGGPAMQGIALKYS